MQNPVVHPSRILMPAPGVDKRKWATVAVDQYTSQIDYWREVEALVGDAPSALRVTLPEVYLSEREARTPGMQASMRSYLEEGVLVPAVEDGYVLVERTTGSGIRTGLMAALDLEQYDFTPGSKSLIRPTEGTVLERVPPRVEIRRGACIELPHVLMLLDDADCSVIEPMYENRASLELLYDFELMQGGGHLRGYRVEGEAAHRAEAALDRLYAGCEGLFLAVGDGNHSLAAARACWLELKQTLTEEEQKNHPARYALVEIENLHSEAIRFAPIHRILRNVDPKALMDAYEAHLTAAGIPLRPGDRLRVVAGEEIRSYGFDTHPLRDLQAFLDAYLAAHPEATIDYIHGDEVLLGMAREKNTVGFMPCALGKEELFPFIRRFGVLPRKTFSMGEAHEKRYYYEARGLCPLPTATACFASVGQNDLREDTVLTPIDPRRQN